MKVRQLYFALISLNLLFIYSLDASTIVLAFNAGGSSYNSSWGFLYSSDEYYTSGNGYAADSLTVIKDTVNQLIYRTERYDDRDWGYNLPISVDGSYVLILQFAEIFQTTANSRVFTVKIGDYIVAYQLDLFAKVGKNTAYDIFTPFILSNGAISINGAAISGAYSGGKLSIQFEKITENPKISGLILVKGDCSVADNCNMCYQARCLECNAAELTCETCITNASTTDGVCYCNGGTFWVASSRSCVFCDNLCISCSSDNFICAACSGSNVLVSSVCLRACPYGFDSSCGSVSAAVIDQNFANYFYGSYGLFQTGTSSSTYYFFNTPENVDPIPAKNRGLFFSGGSYLQTTSTIYISLNFSIGMWVWILSGSGDILSNGNKITIAASGTMTILLESKELTMTTVTTAALNPSNSAWAYISFIISFSSSTVSTTIVPYLNNSPQTSIISSGYIFRDDINNILNLGKSSSSNFLGFLHQFTLWNTAISNFDTQYSDQICGTGAISSCLWTCPLSQWMNGAASDDCKSCTKGCVRNISCNVCDDPLCGICTGFLTGLCTQCVANASGTPCACNTDYYWDSTTEKCEILCDYTCKTCTSSASSDCIICASGFYMYLGWCISKCPDGFIESGSICVENDTFIFYLSFDILKGVVFDKQSKIPALTGNSTDFYPDYDEFDPVAAFLRGFYFNGVSSMMHLPLYSGYSNPVLSFGYSFTFSIWINMENGFGTILSKQDLLYNPKFSLQLAAGVPLISLNFKVTGLNPFFYLQSLESYEWSHIAFTAEYTNLKQTKMVFYLNGVIDHQFDAGFDYFKDTKAGITFTLGAEKDSSGYKSYFKGFIYDIKGYNSIISISSLVSPAEKCTENCKACLTNGICIPNCLISQYWNGPQYNKCYNCSSGCLSCRDSSNFCNLCNNQKCASCYDFTSDSCLKCISGTSNTVNCECDYGLAWNSTLGVCETCHLSQFEANDSCYDCPPLCTQCDNESKCTWCISNATLSSGSCICSPGYIGTTACTYIPFDAFLSVNKNDTLILIFSDVLKQDLASEQILIQIHNNTIPSWSISKLSSTEYLISCSFDGEISEGTIIKVLFINSTNFVSISGGVIREEFLLGSLYSSSMTPQEQEVFQIKKVFSSKTGILVASSVALSLFNPNPSLLWNILNNIQLLSYIPYASYPLTDKVSKFFKSLADFKIVPNLFLYCIDQSKSNPPYYQARKYGYDSYLILVNAGNDLCALSGLIAIIPIVYFLSKCPLSCIAKKLKQMLRDYKFSVFLRFWILYYLEISFSSIIGVLSTKDNKILENPLEFTNYLICWFLIIPIVITPFLHAYFSFKNSNKIINKRDKEWLVTWKTLYCEFKNNRGFMSTQFYTLYFARRLVFITVQVFLNDFPIGQLAINAVSSLCIILFLIFYRPFDDFVIQWVNLITELGIFVIFILLSPYCFELESLNIKIMDNLIIYFTTFIMAVQTAGPFINSLKEIYYIYKRKKKNHIHPDLEEPAKDDSFFIKTQTMSSDTPWSPTFKSRNSKTQTMTSDTPWSSAFRSRNSKTQTMTSDTPWSPTFRSSGKSFVVLEA